MKKILFLLLSTVAMYGQVPADATPLENIQITNNTTDNSATKVNVQSTDGTINTISKSDLVNVVEVNDVPSLPLVGEVGKIYVVKNVNKIYRWNGTFYQELAVADISGKEDIANKQNSLSVDGSNTKYPTVTAVNTGLGLKENILNNPITGVGSQNNANTYALQDGTVLYHSAKWFVPSGAVSTIGATVTSVDTQFTSAMVGAKLTINGEWRVITAYTNSKTVITQSGYSQNYSNVVAGNWGCYSRCSSITSTGHVYYYSYQGMVMFTYIPSDQANVRFSGFSITGNEAAIQPVGALLRDSAKIFWSNNATYYGTKDLGLRRNSAGVLEIYDGITPTGLEANRRDLLARNLFGSKVLIGSIVDDNVNQGQYTGTISSGTTALGNTPPTANNQLTRKDYVDTGLALKANLASPALTGTPTAPTAAVGTNTTQIATTAFVQAGLNLKSNLSDITLQRAYDTSTDKKIQTLAIRPFTLKAQTAAASDNVFVIENSSGFAVASVGAQGKLWATSASVEGSVTATSFNGSATLTGTPTAPTAAVGTNTTQIATTAFVNGGLATKENTFSKNTAFNKNFGTTAGTVVEGGTLGSNAYSSTTYLPLTGGTLSGALGVNNALFPSSNIKFSVRQSADNNFAIGSQAGIMSIEAFDDTFNFLVPLEYYALNHSFKGGNATFSGTVTATSFNGSATLTGTPTAPTAAVGTNTTQIATTAFVQSNSRPYKVYTALLSQSGTNAPTAVVLENTLGGTVTFTRSSTGVYLVNSSGLFTADKTFVIMGAGANAAYTNAINLVDSSTFYIVTKESSTQSSTDSANTKVAFEIRVYL